jgi:hypothetical protein
MDMPQKVVFEKLIFRGDKRQVSVSFLPQRVANLIEFMAGLANELWNVVGSVMLTFFLEPQPTQADNDISDTIH